MNDRPVTLHQNPNPDPTLPRWITDAGHGWLEVSRHAYPDALDHGSTYSYATADVVALEEDCDAGRFLDQHPELDVHGLTVVDWSTVGNGDAPVRTWARCTNGPAVTA